MANDKGQTTGSVLFSSLAKGLQGLQQGMEQKRQNDLQNLMMAMKVQDAEMNREAFLQSQQLREQQVKNAQQSFKKGQLELNRLADPIGTARREAEAQAEAQAVFDQKKIDDFMQSQNVPIPLIGKEAMNFAQNNYLSNLKETGLDYSTAFDPILGVPTKLQLNSQDPTLGLDIEQKKANIDATKALTTSRLSEAAKKSNGKELNAKDAEYKQSIYSTFPKTFADKIWGMELSGVNDIENSSKEYKSLLSKYEGGGIFGNEPPSPEVQARSAKESGYSPEFGTNLLGAKKRIYEKYKDGVLTSGGEKIDTQEKLDGVIKYVEDYFKGDNLYNNTLNYSIKYSGTP